MGYDVQPECTNGFYCRKEMFITFIQLVTVTTSVPIPRAADPTAPCLIHSSFGLDLCKPFVIPFSVLVSTKQTNRLQERSQDAVRLNTHIIIDSPSFLLTRQPSSYIAKVDKELCVCPALWEIQSLTMGYLLYSSSHSSMISQDI